MMSRDLIGILAALIDPLKILAFGGLGFFYANTSPKWLWGIGAACAFFAMVYYTPDLYRSWTLDPSPHRAEDGFDLKKTDPNFFYSDYGSYWKHFIDVRSATAMAEVKGNIDRYKKDCIQMTGGAGWGWDWRRRCDEHIWATTGIAGAIQFGLALFVTCYLQGWRFRPAPILAGADNATVGLAAVLLRVCRAIVRGVKGYGARIRDRADQ